MTTVARRIASTPVRTATDTWALIRDIVSVAGLNVAQQLELAANTACMLIAEEHTKTDPIVITGCGPQIRIYTLHGNDAIDGSTVNEQPLTITADDDWRLSIPASGADYELARAVFADFVHVAVYDPAATPTDKSLAKQPVGHKPLTIDLSALET